MENWKDIQDYEDLYEVSSTGKIRRKERTLVYKNGKIFHYKLKELTLLTGKDGYLKINLHKNSKLRTFRVNRLVAIHFIPNPSNLSQVNHEDGNKLNNNDWNLKWCDTYQNLSHSYETGLKKIKLTKGQVVEIKDMYKNTKLTQKQIGIKYGVQKEHINGIINNRKRINV
jgi:hypothetical protein